MIGPQLITYPDSFGGSLAGLDQLLSTDLSGLFPAGVHVLPPFRSSGDRGFAPIRYDRIDPAFGTADDLRRVAAHGGLTLDLMVNHISRRSPEFEDFLTRGRDSQWADLFITESQVWPRGVTVADRSSVALRRPDGPLMEVELPDGTVERIWATFGDRLTGRPEQIDVDLSSPLAERLLAGWFDSLAGFGATTVRLDAVGYVAKRAGTDCFMVEPDIWRHLHRLRAMAADVGLDVLPEVHSYRAHHLALADRGYLSYDFVLPAMVLHAIFTGRGEALRAHLAQSPSRQVTTLDTHDGIPILPDLSGVLPEADLRAVVDACVERGANVSRVFGATPGMLDTHQINITYADAVGDDDAYLAARAIQLFAPGLPQIYYVGLLAGRNAPERIEMTGDGREVNRRGYSLDEVRSSVTDPLVRRLFEMVTLRATHPAFQGDLHVEGSERELMMTRSAGSESVTLRVDLTDPRPDIAT